jgi:hypothetical protein
LLSCRDLAAIDVVPLLSVCESLCVSCRRHLIVIGTPDVAGLYQVTIGSVSDFPVRWIEVAPEDGMIRDLFPQFSHSESQTVVSAARVKN